MSTKDRWLPIIGHDPSMTNWGLAAGLYNLNTKELLIHKLAVINAEVPKGKQVRQNSKDVERAYQLHEGVTAACRGCKAAFIEVPVGSQSARAMASYGICVGILGAIKGRGVPFFEVTPTEVKLAGPGKKGASKAEMIEWAVATHPEANWPWYIRNGIAVINKGKAEHMADAIAAIYAGLNTPEFKKVLDFNTI